MSEEHRSPSSFRSYLLFWSGQKVSLLGSNIAKFVIIWWITIETASPFYLALASLAALGPLGLLTPFTGALIDRWNRKLVLGLADLFQAIINIGIIIS